MDNKINIIDEEGNEIELIIIETAKFEGRDYILASESDNAYILKDVSEDKDSDSIYEFVDDEKELDMLADVFSELISDMDIDLEK
jgi:hypothetical protein